MLKKCVEQLINTQQSFTNVENASLIYGKKRYYNYSDLFVEMTLDGQQFLFTSVSNFIFMANNIGLTLTVNSLPLFNKYKDTFDVRFLPCFDSGIGTNVVGGYAVADLKTIYDVPAKDCVFTLESILNDLPTMTNMLTNDCNKYDKIFLSDIVGVGNPSIENRIVKLIPKCNQLFVQFSAWTNTAIEPIIRSLLSVLNCPILSETDTSFVLDCSNYNKTVYDVFTTPTKSMLDTFVFVKTPPTITSYNDVYALLTGGQ